MKIVNFSSGLGNQVFIYLLVKYLERTFPKEHVYGYYNKRWLQGHNGLEIHKVLDVDLPKATRWSDFVAIVLRIINKLVRVPFVATDDKVSKMSILYKGYWQDKKFFLDNIDNIHYRNFELDEENKQLIHDMEKGASVSIHVRRGDYLTEANRKIYGGICTLEYYKRAIQIAEDEVKKARNEEIKFYVFSNDIEWCKANLSLPNVVFVNHNHGPKSYLDMFLMSHCQINILANSSFSYWGAMLNHRGGALSCLPQEVV